MNVTIVGRHIELTEAMKEHISRVINEVEKYNLNIMHSIVTVVKDNPLVEKGKIRSYFLHTYALKEINDNLECLAVQDDEICIFKVRDEHFYGVSFHPEVLNRKIITNFLYL